MASLGGGRYIWEGGLERVILEWNLSYGLERSSCLRACVFRLNRASGVSSLHPNPWHNPLACSVGDGFRSIKPVIPSRRLCRGCSVYEYRRNSLRVSREVRRSLYGYTMCTHKDLRTCEKVGELWSTSVLTLKLANHSSHQRWLFQKAGRSWALSLYLIRDFVWWSV